MKTLLIVDDEIDIREFAKRFFTKKGIEVLCASNGKEALKIIENITPDLMLLDVNMTEMDGVETLEYLRSKGSKIKIIMVTGVEEKEVVDKITQLGIKGLINKPLILNELQDVVLKELGIELDH